MCFRVRLAASLQLLLFRYVHLNYTDYLPFTRSFFLMRCQNLLFYELFVNTKNRFAAPIKSGSIP